MDQQAFKVGDVVSYEDTANPLALYTVTAHDAVWDSYTLRNVLTSATEHSDCRQRGWRLVRSEPGPRWEPEDKPYCTLCGASMHHDGLSWVDAHGHLATDSHMHAVPIKYLGQL